MDDFLCTRCNHFYPIEEQVVIFEGEPDKGECRACHFERPENRGYKAGGICANCFHKFPEILYCGCLNAQEQQQSEERAASADSAG